MGARRPCEVGEEARSVGMKAFITGSRAYGLFTLTSDLDLAILIDQEDAALLREHAEEFIQPAPDYQNGNYNYRFGPLNLLVFTDPVEFQAWRKARDELAKIKVLSVGGHSRGHSRDVAIATIIKAVEKAVKEQPVPISVSLMKIAGQASCESLIPDDLRTILQAVADTPSERAGYGILAEWMNDNGEPDLAAACMMCFKRDEVKLVKLRGNQVLWEFSSLPPAINSHYSAYSIGDSRTLLSAFACLAEAIAKTKQDLGDL